MAKSVSIESYKNIYFRLCRSDCYYLSSILKIIYIKNKLNLFFGGDNMKACMCILAGTRACDTCSNGPSRMKTSIPNPFEQPTPVHIEKLTININTEDDPKVIKNALINALKETDKELIRKNHSWSTTSLS